MENTLKRKCSQDFDSEDGRATDSRSLMNLSLAEDQHLAIQEQEKNTDQEYEKLAVLNESIDRELIHHQMLFDKNKDTMRLLFPNPTILLMNGILRTLSKNSLVDSLEDQRGEQEIVYINNRNKLAKMKETFENIFPDFVPQGGNDYVAKHSNSPATNDEETAALMASISPKAIVTLGYRPEGLPRFCFAICRKSTRVGLPPAYAALIERGRLFPDHPPTFISYDTARVIEKMINPDHRKPTDSFKATKSPVWVWNSQIQKYERHENQHLFHCNRTLIHKEMKRRDFIYVAVSDNSPIRFSPRIPA